MSRLVLRLPQACQICFPASLPLGAHFDTSRLSLPSKPRILPLAALIYAPLAAGGLLWARLADDRCAWSFEPAWWEAPPAIRLAASIASGLALGIAVVAVTPWIVERAVWARALREEMKRIIDPLTPREITGLALASGIAEEIFFRGAMQPAWGLVITSVIFGAFHLGPRGVFPAWAIWAFVMGLSFGVIFEVTGSLWGPVVAHVWINQRNMLYLQRH